MGISDEVILPKMWEGPTQSNCPKRQLRAILKKHGEVIAVGYNSCAPNGGHYWDSNIPIEHCVRLKRDRNNGKDWPACNGFHAELGVFLALLIQTGVINGSDYSCLASRFARWRFDGQEGPVLLRELFDLVPEELAQRLKGAELILEGLDWVCYFCGQVLKHFGITTVHPIAQNPLEEPSAGN